VCWEGGGKLGLVMRDGGENGGDMTGTVGREQVGEGDINCGDMAEVLSVVCMTEKMEKRWPHDGSRVGNTIMALSIERGPHQA
jgi:hypothetical protein